MIFDLQTRACAQWKISFATRTALLVLIACAALSSRIASAFEIVQPSGEDATLSALWQPATATGARPVVLMLHGCGGLYTRGEMRFRSDIPNSVIPDGVHAGGNPAARAKALQMVDQFFGRALQ